jgi:putative ABC transport system ATP-binding protein
MQSAPSLVSKQVNEGEFAVSLDNVSKIYHMGQVEVPALRDVNVKVPKGELVVILGPSGSGKTTLLNIIGGLDSPTTGQVLIGGTDISRFNEAKLTRARRTLTGFVFQFFNLIPTLTARENVELAAHLAGTRHLVDPLLEQVGLAARAHQFPRQLSGGEQQRVSIARALVTNAPIILADEPTGSLDFETGRRILQLISQICQEQGDRSFLLVTHNAAISQMAHRVIRLKDGRIVENRQNTNPIDPGELQW